MGRRGLAPATREAYGRVARSYLVFLEARGIAVLGRWRMAPASWCFLESLLEPVGHVVRCFWVVSNFRPFLKFHRPHRSGQCAESGWHQNVFHAILPVLEDADEELVCSRLCVGGGQAARDAAITLLALSTGLRACDIVELRMGDVDWRGHTIGLVQQKTGNPADAAVAGVCCWASWPPMCSTSVPAPPMITYSCVRWPPHTRLNDHATVHRVTVETFPESGG